jgi:hypothetical protein
VAAPQKTKSRSADAFPFKGVARELAAFRTTFHELVGNYTAHVDAQIAEVELAIAAGSASRRKLPAERAHDYATC